MAWSERGLYESLVTEALEAQLHDLGERLQARRSGIHEAEAADRIALHLGRVIERAIASLDRHERVKIGTALARQLVDQVVKVTKADLTSERPLEAGEVLRSILGMLPDGSPEVIEGPLVPLFDTTLLTNAPGEPRVGSQVLTEVHSADRVDVVMAFIRQSGIRPFLAAHRFVEPHPFGSGNRPRVERSCLRRAQPERRRQGRCGFRKLLEWRRVRSL